MEKLRETPQQFFYEKNRADFIFITIKSFLEIYGR